MQPGYAAAPYLAGFFPTSQGFGVKMPFTKILMRNGAFNINDIFSANDPIYHRLPTFLKLPDKKSFGVNS